MSFRIRCLVLQVSLPEVYDKTAEINGFTVLQLLFEGIRLCHPWQKEYGLTSNHWILYSATCQHVRPYSLCSCWIKSKNCTAALSRKTNLTVGVLIHTLAWHTMEAWCVSLTPNILFNTANSYFLRGPSISLPFVSKEWPKSDSHAYQQ